MVNIQHLTKTKALVVDDMQSMRNLIKVCLQQLGLAVNNISEAANGKNAFDILQVRSFDLVVCDWDMPVMDGLQLLTALRADERLVSTRFLMLTANAQMSKVSKAIEAGVDDYIAKPFKPETLQSKVIRLLNKPAPA